METSGIYKITNIINNKFYIGSAINIKRRWIRHKTELKNNIHSNQHLQKSYNKYGIDYFKYEIILECDIKDCINKEQFFIDALNPYYNICKIAGSCLGIKRTKEQNEARSKLFKGRKMPDHVKEKLRIVNSGKKQSIEQIEKRTAKLRKKVYQFDLNGVFIKEWDSATEVNKIYNCSSIISRVCTGKRPSAYNYIWLYTYDAQEVANRIKRIINSKPIKQINQLTKDGVFIQSFNSMTEVETYLNNKNANKNIHQVFTNKKKSAYGYKWEKILL